MIPDMSQCRLVVLNSCQTLQGNQGGSGESIGYKSHDDGRAQAVVGWQIEADNDVGMALDRRFWHRVTKLGQSVSQAVAGARDDINNDPSFDSFQKGQRGSFVCYPPDSGTMVTPAW